MHFQFMPSLLAAYQGIHFEVMVKSIAYCCYYFFCFTLTFLCVLPHKWIYI